MARARAAAACASSSTRRGKALAIEGSHLLARRRPAAEHRRPRPRQGRHRDRRARLHHGRRRAAHERARASGRSATSTAAAPSPTPRTTTSRSSPANLLDGEPRRVSDRIPTYALFIDPPLGRVGMSEAEVRARGKPALVGVMPMTRVGRARERGETQGFMKVLVDAETEQHPRRLAARHRRRRDRAHAARRRWRGKLSYTVDPARDAHPSDRERADSDAARIAGAAGLGRRNLVCADLTKPGVGATIRRGQGRDEEHRLPFAIERHADAQAEAVRFGDADGAQEGVLRRCLGRGRERDQHRFGRKCRGPSLVTRS